MITAQLRTSRISETKRCVNYQSKLDRFVVQNIFTTSSVTSDSNLVLSRQTSRLIEAKNSDSRFALKASLKKHLRPFFAEKKLTAKVFLAKKTFLHSLVLSFLRENVDEKLFLFYFFPNRNILSKI